MISENAAIGERRADVPALGGPPLPDSIAACRALIDEVDEQILALITRRRQISREVQTRRMAAGGPRVELDRENAVLARFADRLGSPGRDLALAVLSLCRGPVPGQGRRP